MPYNSVAESFHRKKFVKRYERKSIENGAISLQRGHFEQKFQVEGDVPHQ